MVHLNIACFCFFFCKSTTKETADEFEPERLQKRYQFISNLIQIGLEKKTMLHIMMFTWHSGYEIRDSGKYQPSPNVTYHIQWPLCENVNVTKRTLGPTYNEFGYCEHPATTSRFLCIKIIDSNVKKFGYYEHTPTTCSFLCIYLLVISGTQCNCEWP